MFAALFSVLLLTSENSAAAAAVPQEPVASEAVDPNKKICKRQPVTGQLQGTKRVCMTAEQWKRAQEAAQRKR
jgi:hypothetical protein